MDHFIITEDTIVAVDFKQASVFVDACFLLQIKDANDPVRQEKAKVLLQKLKDEEAEKIVISNHVITEVLHNIFKRRIRNVLYLKYRWDKEQTVPNSEEKKLLGDVTTANALVKILIDEGLEYKLEELLEKGDFYFSIDKLVKLLKKKYPSKRDGLTQYYKESAEEYMLLIHSLNVFGLKVEVGKSDENLYEYILDFSARYQLESYDAAHLVIAEFEGCNYLITFDGDFINNYYQSGYNNVKIINVAI